MDYLTLYRGDYTRIRKFAFHKTNRNCFVGQGIYLTDSIEIADTYRTKGADWDIRKNNKVFEYERAHATKGEFLEALFKAYVKEVLNKKIENATTQDRFCFQDEIEQKKITISHHTGSIFGRRYDERVFTATRRDDERVGYLTKFNFPRRLFNDGVLSVHKRVSAVDKDLIHALYQARCFKSSIKFGMYVRNHNNIKNKVSHHEWKETTVEFNTFEKLWDYAERNGLQQSGLKYDRARVVLEDFGYIGFEYNGGQNTGGRRHRAFCVWSEDFVNEHKVMTSRLETVVSGT